ncbi:MAG: cob(I)yrinic acid a,c-diamide adenosyltransferase [Tenericutes bacterium]|jgi:cob(I)alamin adenosyltransferase|nr:cob(I)yrinic acid a,c-diamide adenosyltransferase [Mycoplasmatota bacterium]
MSITKLSQISTKNGDKGTSKNYNNDVYDKDDSLFEVLGTFDELNSFLGLAYHYSKVGLIKQIQLYLQNMSSLIATKPKSAYYSSLNKIDEKDVFLLEENIEKMLLEKPLENQFYLPGSEKTKPGAYFDVCRTIARRAERRLITFTKEHKREDLDIVKKFINRLSDLLFILSMNQ